MKNMEKEIVYTYVVADLLHMGHILYLENAKKLGKKLVVGVLTDEAVMEKKKKPTISFSERMRLINALGCVDIVVPQTTYSPIQNIKDIIPDILVESSSHKKEDLEKIEKVCNDLIIKIVKFPYYPEQSSTKIKEKIR